MVREQDRGAAADQGDRVGQRQLKLQGAIGLLHLGGTNWYYETGLAGVGCLAR